MERADLEELFYGKADQERRFTQDFPILPDVWIEYGKKDWLDERRTRPRARRELLLSPHNEFDAPTAARTLRERLAADPKAPPEPVHPDDRRRILYNESVVLAALTFDELLRGALPLTDWWKRSVGRVNVFKEGGPPPTLDVLRALGRQLRDYKPGHPTDLGTDARLLHKLIRVVSCIEADRLDEPMDEKMRLDSDLSDREIDIFATLFENVPLPDTGTGPGLLWGISVNREAATSIWRSRLTIKADAAERVFNARTRGIRWAVLDTGIDARHPAFRRRNADGTFPQVSNEEAAARSRIVKTYDFLRIKDLLDPTVEIRVEGTQASQFAANKLEEMRSDLTRSLQRGRAIDWDLLEPFLRVPHTAYRPPRADSHGTHVAGILASDWPEAAATPLQRELIGVCPDLELYDLRVLPDEPNKKADEFTIIAALQFVRHLNAHKDLMVVHGVNLSLSVPHDVANYACGRTPVCEECERVVASGVVVVTAAGNRGFNKLREASAGAQGDYRYISITDPGNADGVITVGSTHREKPHNYGVSYFSSRGPTGDGRTKPDLVAPGERIDSASLNGYFETKDGTSMAAPHVSGAAALLMSRHRELIGQPRRVKEILCRSATDLGREPRFQGAGLIDVLRALQSV
jgi:hypothetical protein